MKTTLRDLAVKSGKRQDHIAAQLGVSDAALSRWLSGHSRLPALHVLGLAKEFGVSVQVVLAAAKYTNSAQPSAGDNR